MERATLSYAKHQNFMKALGVLKRIQRTKGMSSSKILVDFVALSFAWRPLAIAQTWGSPYLQRNVVGHGMGTTGAANTSTLSPIP